jgi:hypothetical protein
MNVNKTVSEGYVIKSAHKIRVPIRFMRSTKLPAEPRPLIDCLNRNGNYEFTATRSTQRPFMHSKQYSVDQILTCYEFTATLSTEFLQVLLSI